MHLPGPESPPARRAADVYPRRLSEEARRRQRGSGPGRCIGTPGTEDT